MSSAGVELACVSSSPVSNTYISVSFSVIDSFFFIILIIISMNDLPNYSSSQLLDDNKYSTLELQLIDIEESINYSVKSIPPLRENYLRCMQIFFSCSEFFQSQTLKPIHKVLRKMHSCLEMIFSRMMEVCESTEDEKKVLQNHFDQKTKEYTIKKVLEQRHFRLGLKGIKPGMRKMGGTVLSEETERGIDGGQRRQMSLQKEIDKYIEDDNKLIDEIQSYLAHQHEIINTFHKDDLGVKLYRILEYFKDCEDTALAFMNSKEWKGQPLPEFNLAEVLAICDASNKRLKCKLAQKASETIQKHVNQALGERTSSKFQKQQMVQTQELKFITHQNTSKSQVAQQIYAAMQQSLKKKNLKRKNSIDSRRGGSYRSNNASIFLQQHHKQALTQLQSSYNNDTETDSKIITAQINQAIQDELMNVHYEGVPSIDQELKIRVRSIMRRLGIQISDPQKQMKEQYKRKSNALSERSSVFASSRESAFKQSELSSKYFQQISKIANASNKQSRRSHQNQGNRSQESSLNSRFSFRTSLDKHPKINMSDYHKDIVPTDSIETQQNALQNTTSTSTNIEQRKMLRKQSKFKINLPPGFNSRQQPSEDASNTPVIMQQRKERRNSSSSSSSSDSNKNQHSIHKSSQRSREPSPTNLRFNKKISAETKSILIDQVGETVKSEGTKTKLDRISSPQNLVKSGTKLMMRSTITPQLSNRISMANQNVRNYRPTVNEFYRNRLANESRGQTLISIKRQRIGQTSSTATPLTSKSQPAPLFQATHYSRLQTQQACHAQTYFNQCSQFNLKSIVQSIKTLGMMYRKYRNANPSKQLKIIFKELSIGFDIFNYSNMISRLQIDIENHLKRCDEDVCTHLKILEDTLNQNIKAFEKIIPKSTMSSSTYRGSDIIR